MRLLESQLAGGGIILSERILLKFRLNQKLYNRSHNTNKQFQSGESMSNGSLMERHQCFDRQEIVLYTQCHYIDWCK